MDTATVERGLRLRFARAVGGCEMPDDDAEDDSDGGVTERKVLTGQQLLLVAL